MGMQFSQTEVPKIAFAIRDCMFTANVRKGSSGMGDVGTLSLSFRWSSA